MHRKHKYSRAAAAARGTGAIALYVELSSDCCVINSEQREGGDIKRTYNSLDEVFGGATRKRR